MGKGKMKQQKQAKHKTQKLNYTYILECRDGTYYTGWTTDIDHRIKMHNSGQGAKYTRSRVPVKLVYLEASETKQRAMQREYAIKHLTRKEKERLVTEYETLKHNFRPIYDENSKILILGTFPSVKSREQNFYYGHPQNRFWKLLAALMEEETPVSINDKKTFLLDHGIAIWDVIESCDIIGSSDSSIKNVIPNQLDLILQKAPIKQIYCNGGKAWELYHKYQEKDTGRPAVKLPSTSPANAAFSMERLGKAWEVIKLETYGENTL